MASGKGTMKISSNTYSTPGDFKQTRKPCFPSVMPTTHFWGQIQFASLSSRFRKTSSEIFQKTSRI